MSESSRFFRVRSQCPWGGRSGREPSWGGKLSTVCAGHPGGLSVQLCPPDSNSQSWQDPCPGGVPGAGYPRPRISSSPAVSAQQRGSHRSLALGKTATVAEGKRSAPLGSHICRVPSFKIKQKLFKGRRGGGKKQFLFGKSHDDTNALLSNLKRIKVTLELFKHKRN